MPCAWREKRVSPAVCRTTTRPLSGVRARGPGVGDHKSPDSSSRMNSASVVGSLVGSFANGVNRFSRLFADHVYADPDAVTMVPNRGLAITFVHGIGVSSVPSRTSTYALPSSANPPIPLDSVMAGGGFATRHRAPAPQR